MGKGYHFWGHLEIPLKKEYLDQDSRYNPFQRYWRVFFSPTPALFFSWKIQRHPIHPIKLFKVYYPLRYPSLGIYIPKLWRIDTLKTSHIWSRRWFFQGPSFWVSIRYFSRVYLFCCQVTSFAATNTFFFGQCNDMILSKAYRICWGLIAVPLSFTRNDWRKWLVVARKQGKMGR